MLPVPGTQQASPCIALNEGPGGYAPKELTLNLGGLNIHTTHLKKTRHNTKTSA